MVVFRSRILQVGALLALAALFAAANSKLYAQGMNSPSSEAAAPIASPGKEAVASKRHARRRVKQSNEAEAQRNAPASGMIIGPGRGSIDVIISH